MKSIKETPEYEKWLKTLVKKNIAAAVKVSTSISKFATTGQGNAKALGGGISELKIKYPTALRVYYTIRGGEIILLLLGGDKSSQSRDIEKARKIAARYKGDAE